MVCFFYQFIVKFMIVKILVFVECYVDFIFTDQALMLVIEGLNVFGLEDSKAHSKVYSLGLCCK
jgi:hypothetical protein